jgi:hypothetical protein
MITVEVYRTGYGLVATFTGATTQEVFEQVDQKYPPAQNEYDVLFHPYHYKVLETA